MLDFITKIGNSFVKMVLRSPLHGFFSKSIMLINFKGRKSGKTYTTPVGYARRGDKIMFSAKLNHVWWKNLRGGAPVVLRVEGQDLNGIAEPIVDDKKSIAATLLAYSQSIYHRAISTEEADRFVRNGIMVQVQLFGQGGAPPITPGNP
jgi:hypothetical protein